MDSPSRQNAQHRALGLSVLGAALVVIGLLLAYIGYQTGNGQAAHASNSYEYTVKQNTAADVNYFDSSFYAGKTPSPNNNAYIAQLTNTVKGQFHYEFHGNKATDLTTTSQVNAVVQSNYALKGDSEKSSNVWQKEFTLVPKTTSTKNTADLAFDQAVTVPYADYKKVATDFRTSLQLPTTSQVVVTMTTETAGTIEGTPFTDSRTSSITMPLEEQIYQPAIKFDKEDAKQVVAASTAGSNDWLSKLQLFGGAALVLGGGALIIYGLRKRIFKTAYQRELDKIYRYHDGIIVRTSRPIDLADHQVIPMRSFDDMLNLEEELKSPIIADEISSTLTHFIIAHSNVMYLYKLGEGKATHAQPAAAGPKAAREVLQPDTHPELANIRTYGLKPALSAPRATAPVTPKRPLGKTIPVQHKTARHTHDDLDDIIDEIGKKPHTPKK